jgi:hypothetical protein
LRCSWVQYISQDNIHTCTSAASFVLVYGCLNLHVYERPFCTAHTRLWVNEYAAHHTPCNHSAVEHPMKYIECNYRNGVPHCDREARDIILWGCLNMHLQEFAVCPQHLHQWITSTLVGDIQCAYCYEQPGAYLSERLINIDLTKVDL